MNRTEIVDRLRSMLKQISQKPVDWDALDTRASIASLGFDSLTVLDLLYDMQQEFNVELNIDELADVNTVNDLVTFLQKKSV